MTSLFIWRNRCLLFCSFHFW